MSLEAFRAEARAFLEMKLRADRDCGEARAEHGGLGLVSGLRTEAEEAALIASAREWQAALFDAGFGWVDGPEEHGGRGLPDAYRQALAEVLADFDVPSTAPLGVGLGMVGPTLLAHGSDLAKERYLRGIYRGDVIACQLFSEPDAGSDLASLQTTATKEGEQWKVTGQKVWTSRAHFADVGLALCRSDPDASKHRGITALLIDMDAPGVSVRPLKQMSGAVHFNEVFLDAVSVPDWCRVGPVNDGWRVATATIRSERVEGIAATSQPLEALFAQVAELERSVTDRRSGLARDELAGLYIAATLARLNKARDLHASIQKLTYTGALSRASAVVSRLTGAAVTADSGQPNTYRWNELILGAPGYRIGGGTDEIQRNILAERALDLPR